MVSVSGWSCCWERSTSRLSNLMLRAPISSCRSSGVRHQLHEYGYCRAVSPAEPLLVLSAKRGASSATCPVPSLAGFCIRPKTPAGSRSSLVRRWQVEPLLDSSRRSRLHDAPASPSSPSALPREMGSTGGNSERAEALEKLCDGYKSSKFPECPEIRPRQLWEMMPRGGEGAAESPVVVVDVRRREEQQVSMLPGAITQDEFEARQEQLKDKQICCYCTVGYRSGIFANSLRGKGCEASNLRGSILAWTQEGLPLVKRVGDSQESTKQVHTFGKEWEPLHGEGYEPVIFRRPLLKGIGQLLGGLW